LKVKTFTEKPNVDLAKVFIESVTFTGIRGSSSGISCILSAFEKHMPDSILCSMREEIFLAQNRTQLHSKTYAECRSISIDYGIMESDNVYVMLLYWLVRSCTGVRCTNIPLLIRKGNSLIRV